ncbi:hypothetical protein AB2M62_13585 [Sphingomonas sp. MMS12-HWE2-04]|uniref:hypothetical protein n=1 Tax=Sphingomonas sp. MMS12-HWE2-04 TaxID=3234199 RepID=UPI00384E415F
MAIAADPSRAYRDAMNRRARILALAGLAALALLVAVGPEHRANIEIFAHRQGDTAPQRLQAAIDLGIVGVSVLVTWSKRLAP